MGISIHALREEGDATATPKRSGSANFYPRPPRGGRRAPEIPMARPWEFLSTPSARRATLCSCRSAGLPADFYPRPPRGGRPPPATTSTATRYFYPRPPRGGRPVQLTGAGGQVDFYPRPPRGGRLSVAYQKAIAGNFYPRPPRGGRPRFFRYSTMTSAISIHALREEGDSVCVTGNPVMLNFYPRPPRGGRPDPRPQCPPDYNFYPRPPRGGRPSGGTLFCCFLAISIHALREEGDSRFRWRGYLLVRFLSTPSARRATLLSKGCACLLPHFYPRPPRGGRR